MFGTGPSVVVAVLPTPPPRDFDVLALPSEAHVLVAQPGTGVVVLLDIDCPEWTSRHAWVVHAYTVADLFIRVGLQHYLGQHGYSCALAIEGTLLVPEDVINLHDGSFGSLIVRLQEDDDTSAASSEDVSLPTTEDDSEWMLCEADERWSESAGDVMSLFQAYQDKVNLVGYTDLPRRQCRSLRPLVCGRSSCRHP